MLHNFELNEARSLINRSKKFRSSPDKFKPLLNKRFLGISNIRDFIRKLRSFRKILYRLNEPFYKNYLVEDANLAKKHIRSSEKILSKLVQSVFINKPFSKAQLRCGFKSNLNLKNRLNAYISLLNRKTNKLLTKILNPDEVDFRKYLKDTRRYYKNNLNIDDRIIEENIESLNWRTGWDYKLRLYKLRLRNEKNPDAFKRWYARTRGIEEDDIPEFKVPRHLRGRSADVFRRKPQI